ncbi:MAG: RsfA family transcriptional regulator [Lysinibacillus sp.]
MSKVRQDAWLDENDELLAEAVIRHVTEGSTQLNAFEEAGDSLNRTAAACGFRWNAVVRKLYEPELKSAKKERKERMRVLGAPTRRRTNGIYTLSSPNTGDSASKSIPLSALSLDIVIAYLLRLQHSSDANNEATKWRHLAHVESTKGKKLEQTIAQLEEENKSIRRDYEQFVQIMNRARRLVTLDEEDERVAPVFKMERNGNLVTSGSIYTQENGDVQN